MFIISLTPSGDTDARAAVYPAHLAWATRGFEDGILLAGARLVPPTGGLMLARHDRGAVERLVADEPLAACGLADIVITEATVMTTASGLEGLRIGQDE